MCGIAGKYDLTSDVKSEDLLLMSKAIAHRGPDDESLWIDEGKKLGLAHRRLAVIDLSEQGNQPMHFLDRYVITYNGEIYNFLELKKQLIGFGITFRTSSDTEVILAAFHQFGKGCLTMLDGMFSFAIYDKESKSLFCARDKFGEKPFYYAASQHSFLFASEMKALWSGGVSKNISESAVYQYLAKDQFLPEVPFYKGIDALKAGHFLEVKYSTKGLTVHTNEYFKLESEVLEDVDPRALRSLILEAVHSRSISDVGFCTSLSGGIDSGVISAICKLQNSELQSYGIGFPQLQDDETNKQKLLASHLKIKHLNKSVNEEELWQILKEVMFHQELPITSMSVCAQNILYKLVRENGNKVLLEGQGADEIFSGYNYHHQAYISELFSEKNFGSAVTQSAFHLWNNKGKITSKIGYINNREQPLNKAFTSAFEKSEKHSKEENDFDNGNLETLLRYADRNSMMYGLEVRQPFLQESVVNAGLAIPKHLKFKYGYKKYLLRKAFEKELPGKILWQREKIGFVTALPKWELMKTISNTSKSADIYFDQTKNLGSKWQFKKMMISLVS